MAENLSDLEIIALVLGGQKDLFSVVVHRYQQAAYKLALVTLQQKADAEDAVSEAFIKAFTGLPGCRKDTNFKSWFLKITYNCCLDILRRKKRLTVFPDVQDGPGYNLERTPDRGPLQDLIEREDQQALWQALNKLTLEERAAIILKYYHETSYQEIAAALNWPMGTVASKLSRARDKLRGLMEGDGYDG